MEKEEREKERERNRADKISEFLKHFDIFRLILIMDFMLQSFFCLQLYVVLRI